MALPCDQDTLKYTIGLYQNINSSYNNGCRLDHKFIHKILTKQNSESIYFVSVFIRNSKSIYLHDVTSILGTPEAGLSCIPGELDTMIARYAFGKDKSQNIDFIYDAASQRVSSISICRTSPSTFVRAAHLMSLR
jgi:hypothetical protein